MTLRTGRGGAGQTYRYYTCSTKARQGKTGCKGRAIPMGKLDHLVADHIADRLLQPEQLEPSSPASSTGGRSAPSAAASILPSFKGESRKPTSTSAVSLTDDDAERTQLALDSSGNQGVSPDVLKGFGRKARERIRLDGGGYRRDHLRTLAQRVEVADDEVRIMGSKSELLRTLAPLGAGNRRRSALRVLY